jgi:protein SCO1/2
MLKKILYTTIILAAAGLIIYSLSLSKKEKPLRLLPIYGENTVINGDTIYHLVPDFRFINQKGQWVSQNDFKGKIYVTDFFFTTCQSICPVMTSNLKSIYSEFKNDTTVAFISHTVDPEYDTVAVLADYAKNHGAELPQWHFVTGKKTELYSIARKGYYLDAQEGNGGPEDFLHTPNFALVDPEHHIRGYYDGTKENEIKKLLVDIKLLKKELGYK